MPNEPMKTTLDRARAAIASGVRPATVLSNNTKTGISILDCVPQLVCYGSCPIRRSCYDVRLLRVRPNVLKNRTLKHFFIQADGVGYSEQAVREIIASDRKSVRIYGGGDFAPHHYHILTRIMRRCPDVKFYMISKTIRAFPSLAIGLLSYPNFFLNMSEASGFHFTGRFWDSLKKHPRVNSVYTLMPDEPAKNGVGYSIVFNVSKSKENIKSYNKSNLKLCPCDAKIIPSEGACAICNRCNTKQSTTPNSFKKLTMVH